MTDMLEVGLRQGVPMTDVVWKICSRIVVRHLGAVLQGTRTMEVARFEDIQTEFMHRAQKAVYCNVATVDRKGRPRSRVMHVIWEGPMGWVITWPESHKAKHLANNPYVSLA